MKFNTIEELSKDISKLGYPKQKRLSSKRLAVITNKNRKDVLFQLENSFRIADAKYDPNPSSTSSIGVLWIGDGASKYSILVKPEKMQGRKSPGIQNEMMVIDNINYAISENAGSPLDIIFTDGKRQHVCKSIVECVETGRDTSGRKKADIHCVSSNGNVVYPISIKMDSTEYWESADKYWGRKAAKYISAAVDKGITNLTEHAGGYYKLIPNLAVKANSSEIKDVVFGTDLTTARGAVILARSFATSDFNVNSQKNTLTIKVSDIIRTAAEIPDRARVYFLIRNDKTRNTPHLPRGIRVLAAYKSRIDNSKAVVIE